MASLRRPSAAIQRGQQQPAPSSSRPPVPAVPEGDKKKNARKSKVGDAIRKRMSMRYMGAEQLTPAVPPPLPGQSDFLDSDPYGGADFDPSAQGDTGESFFKQFGSPEFAQSGFGDALPVGSGGPSGGSAGARLGAEEGIRRRGAADMTREEEWDLDELGKEGFDVAGYIKRTLTGADEDEKQRFKAALMRAKQGNKRELQRHVFKHYAEFVTISKEISTLENDMLELKELLGQWKDLPQLMGMEDTLAPTVDKNGNLERRRTQRNSVMDLQNLYRTQLTQLWSTVEGSQKYLPLVPGRHLVAETHNFVELNAATYKAKQSVSMFLLNDLLLIAGRRRTKGAPPGTEVGDKERERGRMVAERCWVLADLVVVDVKDSGDLTNALKIRRGKEVCVYRTSKPEDKKALLAAFRQVSHELGEKKRKDSEKEQERRKSMWHGDKSAGGLSAGPLPGSGRPLSVIGVSMTDSKDMRWIDEYGDDLTMAIAMRDWDEAVKLVERGRDLLKTVSSNATALAILTAKLDQLTPSLISQLTHDLSSSTIRKASAAKLVTLLDRLDRADLARDVFLRARREVMLKRVRSIKCEGDISIYVSELAIVCFTVLRHTSDWYMTAFKENRMASGFVTWAKEQVETFADLFRRQVYAPNVGPGVSDECIRVTASHNRKLLRDVGLDFTYLLSTLLQPETESAPHPMFEHTTSIPTPAPGYHIEPSPYPTDSYFPETPAVTHMHAHTRVLSPGTISRASPGAGPSPGARHGSDYGFTSTAPPGQIKREYSGLSTSAGGAGTTTGSTGGMRREPSYGSGVSPGAGPSGITGLGAGTTSGPGASATSGRNTPQGGTAPLSIPSKARIAPRQSSESASAPSRRHGGASPVEPNPRPVPSRGDSGLGSNAANASITSGGSSAPAPDDAPTSVPRPAPGSALGPEASPLTDSSPVLPPRSERRARPPPRV